MPLGLGLGITKLKSLVSGLRVRFQGNATITAALDGILRELSADFVSNGTVTAALEAIKCQITCAKFNFIAITNSF